MGLSKFKHVKITGISAVVPKREICIYDEAQYYDNNIKKIDRMRKIVGFFKRRVVDNDTTASDLAIFSAENLIKNLDIDKKELDALIFVRQRPDVGRPATAFYIHEKLKLEKHTLAFDINLGCTGWMEGIYVAHTMIESGACKKVLLLAGDTPSLDISYTDRINAPVFGDGGAACLLEYSNEQILSYFDIGADGSGFDTIISPASGYRMGLRHPIDNTNKKNIELLTPIELENGNIARLTDIYMDGIKVFEFTMKEAPQSIKRLISYAQISKDNIDFLMLHQANKQIVQSVTNAAGFDEEKSPYSSFENYGNASVVSIPIALNHNLANNFKHGQILCCSFGCGLAWASGLFNFNNIYFSGVLEYEPPKNKKTRNDLINYWKNKIKGEEDE